MTSLEGQLRALFRRKFSRESEDLEFMSVVDKLEVEGLLSGAEALLLQILRLFRNLTAHPADYSPTKDDAIMVLNYIFPRLKPR